MGGELRFFKPDGTPDEYLESLIDSVGLPNSAGNHLGIARNYELAWAGFLGLGDFEKNFSYPIPAEKLLEIARTMQDWLKLADTDLMDIGVKFGLMGKFEKSHLGGDDVYIWFLEELMEFKILLVKLVVLFTSNGLAGNYAQYYD